jgi:4-hydroxyphenylpyruvate dioxygenase-like putative hemolysin
MTDAKTTAPSGGRLIQTAFTTDDIHATMEQMTRALGVGPWFLRERGVFQNQLYRGQPSSTALAIAMGYAGDMQFEIIQQLDDSPSIYREAAARNGHGLHHFGMAAADYGAAIAHYTGMGFTLAYEAEVMFGARVGYFDTHGRLPAMIEAIEFLPATQAMFESFRAAARDWDGSDPVRLRG